MHGNTRALKDDVKCQMIMMKVTMMVMLWRLCNFPLPQINFGFCKGDDNFGGRKRKELDDFLKSLGKQMNLVMYR